MAGHLSWVDAPNTLQNMFLTKSLFDLVLTHDLTYCRSSNPSNRFNNRGGFQAGRGRGQFQSWGRGRGQFQSRGRGRAQFQGRGRGRKPEKTADELDKDLESYHAEAMKTDWLQGR